MDEMIEIDQPIDNESNPEIETEVVVVVPPAPASTAAETSETMNALVSTIAALSDSMTALRLEIQTERENYSRMMLDMTNENFNRIFTKIDELKTLEIAEQLSDSEIESLPEKLQEKIEDVEKTARRRWL